MLVKKTEAYKARWADHILPLFAEWEVVEDKSDIDKWGGRVDLLVKGRKNIEGPDGPVDEFEYAHIRWDYGSCSGNDSFYDMSNLEIMKDLLDSVLYFEPENEKEFKEWKNRRSETNGKDDEEDC